MGTINDYFETFLLKQKLDFASVEILIGEQLIEDCWICLHYVVFALVGTDHINKYWWLDPLLKQSKSILSIPVIHSQLISEFMEVNLVALDKFD